ncbi:hypothetical protein Thiowin_04159 [Thiorhodovibrio winogradskyi]|uniref:Mce/MlaD domain-containing protein n=1 Tax=Thiorhodovibrio winogradskyi TaxID=77007 RepID=A0ABZ0SDE0_9GAMM|nr:hypothetical protein [Thiorhodovibrio winogradskyi]
MRHNTLTLQNRVVGSAVVVLVIWAVVMVIGQLRERHAGASYFTLTTDMMGVQVGSLATLNGFEIGQVTSVSLESDDGQVKTAAELLFRVDFQIVAPVVFPAQETFLSIEEVNPVAPARLVIKQLPSPLVDDKAEVSGDRRSAKVIYPCPALQPSAGELIAAGGCIPTLAVEEDVRPGLSGLIAAGTDTLTTATKTLGILELTIAEFAILGQELRENNERLAEMLSDKPGSLYRLPAALEDSATRMADVTEQLRGDMVERVDRMITPETIASLARSITQLEELIATTGHGSQETLENLAAITRGLNRITWELERDPVGFLRGSGGGTR